MHLILPSFAFFDALPVWSIEPSSLHHRRICISFSLSLCCCYLWPCSSSMPCNGIFLVLLLGFFCHCTYLVLWLVVRSWVSHVRHHQRKQHCHIRPRFP